MVFITVITTAFHTVAKLTPIAQFSPIPTGNKNLWKKQNHDQAPGPNEFLCSSCVQRWWVYLVMDTGTLLQFV